MKNSESNPRSWWKRLKKKGGKGASTMTKRWFIQNKQQFKMLRFLNLIYLGNATWRHWNSIQDGGHGQERRNIKKSDFLFSAISLYFEIFYNLIQSLSFEIQELKLAVKYLSKKYGLKDVSWIFKTIWAGKQSKNRQVNQFILIVCHCLVQMLKSLAFIHLFQTKIWEKLMKKVSLAIIFINIANLHVCASF